MLQFQAQRAVGDRGGPDALAQLGVGVFFGGLAAVAVDAQDQRRGQQLQPAAMANGANAGKSHRPFRIEAQTQVAARAQVGNPLAVQRQVVLRLSTCVSVMPGFATFRKGDSGSEHAVFSSCVIRRRNRVAPQRPVGTVSRSQVGAHPSRVRCCAHTKGALLVFLGHEG